jgi:dolichyl-phosphate-mannose-protein mannosyltransferase
MKQLLEKYRFPLFFVTLVLSLCLFYGFLNIFHFSPRSTHQWRQADSASLALNYYQDGLNFFKPRMHYVMGGEGYVTGAGEAPIFYYLVGIGYKLFGPHEGIFRLLSLLTFLLGLFLIAKIISIEARDWFSPVILAGIIMVSPVIAFYSFNFTPNIPAQGLAMIGIWFFYLFYKSGLIKHFHWSMFFYMLAGLIKISSMMSFIVILGLYFLDIAGLLKKVNEQRIFEKAWRFIPGFLAVFAGLFFWKLWADHYNEIHNTNYFLSNTRPYWSLDPEKQSWVYKRIKEIWFSSYYHPYTFWGIGGIGALILLTPWLHKRILYLSFLALCVGCTAFFFLWFRQFEGHDYYIIEMVLLPIMILGMLFLFLNKYIPKLLCNWIFRFTLLAIVAYNAYYTKSILEHRYDQQSVFMSYFNPDLYKTKELHAFLKSLGIQYPDKVVSAPDTSPNNTLYHYNLLGWTELYMGDQQMNAKKVKAYAKAGAKYLLIHNKKYLEKEDLKEVLTYPMGNFNNSIFVFDIRSFALQE